MMTVTDFFSVLLCVPILIYACYSDLKRRSVTNRLWLLMIVVGTPIAIYKLIIQGIPFLILFSASVLFTFIPVYLFYRLRLFGGADAKCLIALSLLIPERPAFASVYPNFAANYALMLFPFAITTLLNAAIFSLCIPPGLFVYNLLTLSREELRGNPGLAFFGYKLHIGSLSDAKHMRLMHLYEEEEEEEGEIKRIFSFGGVEIDTEVVEELKDYHARGKIEEKVWVTPELPFILFITAGFFTALLYGNLIFHLFLAL
ncbi:MAG: A24 family peptidase C-terminal domain-containing protein [Halobacteriota archaeon]